MLLLICGIVCSALVSILMRLSETKVTCNEAMLGVNYAMCALVAAVYAGAEGALALPEGLTAGLGMGNGLLYLGAFVLLQRSIRKNGVVLSATFQKLGLLVSIAVSVLAFHEMPGGGQIAGVVLAVAAIVAINGGGAGTAVTSPVGLLLLLLAGGMADAMSKVFQELGNPNQQSLFLLVTFLTALALCLLWMLRRGQRPGKWEVLFGLCVGIPNYFSSRFLLAALKTVPAVVAYPVYSVGGILLVSAVGVLVFRETLGKRQWLGIGGILLALVLLNG